MERHIDGRIVRTLKAGIRRAGYTVEHRATAEDYARQRLLLVRGIHALLHEYALPELPDTPGRVELLNGLFGTDPIEGMFILDALHRSLRLPGDVCEFGVAQGATSALLANELAHHAADRFLWLYDSFQGLPKPTAKDVLIDDVDNLGSMEAYSGHFAVPRLQVEVRLAAIGWPSEKTRIVEGYFTAETPSTDLPENVCFAYVDFDLYEPIRDVLEAIHARSQTGTHAVIDDYGFFSTGARSAVDEFVTENRHNWKLHRPPDYTSAFAILERVT